MNIRHQLEDWAQLGVDKLWDLKRFQPGLADTKPKLIAHRGSWNNTDRLENTLAAFQHARDLGVWGLELDIHFTREGRPVVNHDANLVRLHNVAEEIANLTWPQIHERAPLVPALAEVLSLKNVHFMVEIKAPLSPENLATLRQDLSGLAPCRDYHLLSLNPDLVVESDWTPRDAWIYVGDFNLKILMQRLKKEFVGGLAGHYLTLSTQVVAELRSLGCKSGTGFAPSKNLFNREWQRGVDWVFTNTPAKIVGDEEWKRE